MFKFNSAWLIIAFQKYTHTNKNNFHLRIHIITNGIVRSNSGYQGSVFISDTNITVKYIILLNYDIFTVQRICYKFHYTIYILAQYLENSYEMQNQFINNIPYAEHYYCYKLIIPAII